MADETKNDVPPTPCPHMDTCPMVQNQRKFHRLAKRFQTTYCLGHHAGCCRRWVRELLGADKVPELMLPHQYDWAQQLLGDAGIGYAALRRAYPVPSQGDQIKTL